MTLYHSKLPDGMHTNGCLNQGDGTYTANLNLFVGVVLVLAHELNEAGVLGFLNIFNGDILFAVDVDREEVHIAPKYITHVGELLI